MSLLRIKQADGTWSNIPAIKGADGVDGKDGAVQYTAGRYIQIDEDTQTINCTVKIGDLVIIDAVPVKDSTNVVSSGGVYDALEAKADKTEIAGLGGEAGFITNSVEDLKNYYKKSETYSQEEVNSLLGNLTRLTLQVVQELPEVGTEHIIYLVPNNESGNNIYEEWVFVQSKWEMIGTTEVDLSNYYTKEEIDNLLSQNSESEIVIYTGLSLYFPNQSTYSYKIGTISADIRTEIANIVNSYYIGGGNFTKPITFDFNGVRLKPIYRGQGTASGGKTTVSFKLELTASSTSDPNKYDLATVEIAFCFEGSQGSFTPYYSSSLYYWGVTACYINYLSKSNTYAYTPSSDYNPATKKYVDDKVLDAIPQKSTMPTASATYLDKVYQYIGEDTEEFTKGFFYQCISETAEDGTVTYIWSELNFNAGGEGELFYCIKFEHPYASYIFNKYDTPSNVEYMTTEQSQMFADYINECIQGTSPFKTSKPLALDIDSNLIFTTSHGNGYNSSGAHTFTFTFVTPVQGATSGTISDRSKLKLKFTTFEIYLKYENGVYSAVDDFKSYFMSRMCEDYLPLNNSKSYTPTGDYNPATKKYVDDAVANAGGGGGSVKESPIIDLKINASLLSGNLNITDEEILGKVSDAFTKYNKGEISLPIFNVMGTLTSIPQLIFIHESQPVTIPLNGNIKYSGSAIHSLIGNLRAYSTFLSFTVSSDDDNNCTVSSMIIVNAANGKVLLTPENTSSYTPTADYHPATKKYVDEAVANAGGGETPDLTTYAKLTDVLTKTNTTEYTPASAYHPATKQYVDQTVASSGGITEESDPTVPLHVKNITQDMISKWNTVEDKLTKEELSTSASEAGLITIDSINYPIVVKGRYNIDVVKYGDNETVTPQILDYTIDESAMPFINAALKRFLKIKQDIGQSLIYTDSSFGDYTMVYMPLDISLLVELLQDATIEYNDYDDSNNSYTKTTAINSDDIKAFTPSIANNFDGHRAVLSVTHYFNEQYQSFDDIKITFKEIYSDYNRKDISLRISSKINYNSEYDFELHTLSLSQNTALHIDKGTGTVIPTSTNDLNNNSGFITAEDLPEPLVIEGVINEVYGKGNRILNPGKGDYSAINKPNENAFAIGEFSTSAGFNTVAYGSGALAEGYNINSRMVCGSASSSGKTVVFENVGNSSHIRVGSKIYNDKLKKAFTVTKVTEHESGEITYRDITITRDSQDENVFSGNNYIINAGSIATHSEGMECQALGNCSHAEGSRALATGYCSHAQNDAATAAGNYSHAGGVWSEANGSCSIAHGRSLTNNVDYSALFGKYATLDAEADADVVFAIGNGNSYDDRNIGLKLVGAKGEGKLYVENTLMGADPSTYAGFDNTKTQVLKHINGVFTWVDE